MEMFYPKFVNCRSRFLVFEIQFQSFRYGRSSFFKRVAKARYFYPDGLSHPALALLIEQNWNDSFHPFSVRER